MTDSDRDDDINQPGSHTGLGMFLDFFECAFLFLLCPFLSLRLLQSELVAGLCVCTCGCWFVYIKNERKPNEEDADALTPEEDNDFEAR